MSRDRPSLLTEAARLARLLVGSRQDQARKVYEFLGTHNNLGRRTLYLNLGYWAEAVDYDGACEALARELGAMAELGPGQRVLDAGFGFGDQDLLWASQHEGLAVTGFNVTPAQVELARERAAEAGLAERLDLREGSALTTGEPDALYDRVVALESGFHFDTREAFFTEALRLLRPGGLLAMADLATPEDAPAEGLAERLLGAVGRRVWQVPEANLYPASGFRERLVAAGFVDIEVRSIAEHVFAPFKAYARVHQADPEVVARANPLLRAAWRMATVDRAPLDYLLLRARKPA